MSSQVKKKPSKKKTKKQRIIVFDEKHGDRYFDASTAAKLQAVALKILTERLKSGYWYFKPEPFKEDPEKEIEKLTKDSEQITDSFLRNAAEERIGRLHKGLDAYKRDTRMWEEIQKAVKEKDGNLAYQLLNSRRNYEYEGFDLEYLENV